MNRYLGNLLTVEDNPTKEGKARYKVQIDVDEHGLKEFNLWDTAYVGEGKDPVMDIREHLGSRVVFDAKKGGPKKDREGNETGEFWPSNLEMIALETELGPEKPVREMARELENETARAVGVGEHVVQQFLADVRAAADKALATIGTE